jgi:aryl-alcohol dehydrogenase-like predicted oxidoreductase
MSDPLTPEEETLHALDDLVSLRLVRYIGCFNWPARRIAKRSEFPRITAG